MMKNICPAGINTMNSEAPALRLCSKNSDELEGIKTPTRRRRAEPNFKLFLILLTLMSHPDSAPSER